MRATYRSVTQLVVDYEFVCTPIHTTHPEETTNTVTVSLINRQLPGLIILLTQRKGKRYIHIKTATHAQCVCVGNRVLHSHRTTLGRFHMWFKFLRSGEGRHQCITLSVRNADQFNVFNLLL